MTLRLVQPQMPDDLPASPEALNAAQAREAIGASRRDHRGAPRWFARDLHELVGPMLPGELWVVGAMTGNGKTTFLLNQVAHLMRARVPVCLFPLEVDPVDMWRRLAAWRLGYPWDAVAMNEWERITDRYGRPVEGAADALEAQIEEDAASPYLLMPRERRATVEQVAKWTRYAVEKRAARVVVIDHVHRMHFGGSDANYRVAVTEAVRTLKDIAVECQVVVLLAAQLNSGENQLDRYLQPTIKRLKESSGISEEADAVLMLSRRLARSDLDKPTLDAIAAGHQSIRDFEDKGVMVVTCRKMRRSDTPRDRYAKLMMDDVGVLRGMTLRGED